MQHAGIEEGEVLMIGEWWLLWMVLTFTLLVTSLVYGWWLQKWGPPYPSYIQKRRAAGTSNLPTFNALSWGWVGDFVWILVLFGLFWAGLRFW